MAEQTQKRHRKRAEWKAEDFRVILDFPERLAQLLRLMLHIDIADWNFAIDRIRQGKAYREWSKSKGRGKGKRHFAAPCDELKLIQKAIYERLLLTVPVHFARHGNQKGSSIITNAVAHVGFALSVFSIDIVNAFPTVYRSRIKANLRKPFFFMLRQFQGVGLSEDDAKLMLEAIVDLVCLHDRLPQGPPTSPRILDIVCMKMDKEIFELLQASSTPIQQYRYTAWSDDLTISSNGEIAPDLREAILGIIRKNGFFPHTREDKTKYMSPETGMVPVVTGLVLNRDGRITVNPHKLNTFRVRLFRWFSLKHWDEKTLGELNGTLGFIRQVYPKTVPSQIRAYVEAIEKRLAVERAERSLNGAGIKQHLERPKVELEKPPRVKRFRKKECSHPKDETAVDCALSAAASAE